MTYLFFFLLLLKKFVLGCNGATKSLKLNTGATSRRCTLFINGATFTRL